MTDMAQPRKRPVLFCSFCGKNQDEVAVLVAGPMTFICDECVALSTEIVAAKKLEMAAASAAASRAPGSLAP